MRSTWRMLSVAGGAALLLVGCEAALSIYASQAADTADSVGQESALLVAATDGMTSEMTAEEAATAAEANAGSFYEPADCYSATAAGATVTYELNDCTGPFGYVHVTGTVEVTYRVGSGGLGFDAETTDLAIDEATVSFTASGEITSEGDARTLTISTDGTVTGRRGHVLTRTGDYTSTWDPTTECLAIDGSWMTTVDEDTWTTTISGFEKCGTSCPADGGRIAWEGPRASLTVEYDGTNRAGWMSDGRREREGTVRLYCD